MFSHRVDWGVTEGLVFFLALVYGQLVVDHILLPDVDRCHAAELVCDGSVVHLLKHGCSIDGWEL